MWLSDSHLTQGQTEVGPRELRVEEAGGHGQAKVWVRMVDSRPEGVPEKRAEHPASCLEEELTGGVSSRWRSTWTYMQPVDDQSLHQEVVAGQVGDGGGDVTHIKHSGCCLPLRAILTIHLQIIAGIYNKQDLKTSGCEFACASRENLE